MARAKKQHRIVCKSQKKRNGDPGNVYIRVRERKGEPYTESPNSSRPKKVRQVKGKVKRMFIVLFTIKGIVHKEFSVSRLKIKLKGRHFDTIQVIEAEYQVMLNTLTEHDYQYAFKK
jgi:hypothetical protein